MSLGSLPRIIGLHLADIRIPDGHPAAGSAETVPVQGYLIRHPDGPILVDTGVGFDNPFVRELYEPACTPIETALARHHVDPDEIVAIVNSHLHFDHCGQNPAFFDRDVAFYVQTVELDAVIGDQHYTDRAWALAPAERRRVISGDQEIAEGVTAIATPGHTRGHQSVVIEAGDRRVVIGAQVVWGRDEFVDECASPMNVDDDPALRRAAVDSIRRIKALRPEAVHFSHCPSHHLG